MAQSKVKEPMVMRLVFLITPRAEFLRRLEIESDPDDPTCETVAVVTPELHYEQHFEGAKKAWITKAKRDFIADFTRVWRTVDNPYGEIARELDRAGDSLIEFDKFWRLQQGDDVLEIDPDWRPS
jgi:hypothetical protein